MGRELDEPRPNAFGVRRPTGGTCFFEPS